jgi:hypothetical protein
MTYTRYWSLSDENQTQVEVFYTYEPGEPASGQYGPPEYYDPGSGPEIEIEEVWNTETDQPTLIEMSEQDAAKFIAYIAENPPEPEYFHERP